MKKLSEKQIETGRVKAGEWLQKQIKLHGNTFFWSAGLKEKLNKKIEKYGNTYFWG